MRNRISQGQISILHGILLVVYNTCYNVMSYENKFVLILNCTGVLTF